ncbi:hypothetical protein LOD99_13597 [Oopsacas minuta]|uniref:Uncharacterized protein n=1 Tax=Oopsacas minuta TaxID=111878 RepID=A0AAV7KI42_9METZ|nr:hypothetical protein LOD99_13597 [Oopsacas minuta]
MNVISLPYCLVLLSLVGSSLCEDSGIASINNHEPMVGDTVQMDCTLIREKLFSTETVNYIVNDDFNVFSSDLNRDSGTIGGIPAFRIQASTSASDDRRTLVGAIIVSNLEKTDFVDGILTLGCVGLFGSDPGDNDNVTISATLHNSSNNSASTSVASILGIWPSLLSLVAPILLL